MLLRKRALSYVNSRNSTCWASSPEASPRRPYLQILYLTSILLLCPSYKDVELSSAESLLISMLVHVSYIQETASSVNCPNLIFTERPDRLWYPLRPYSVVTGRSFPGVKRPGREADHYLHKVPKLMNGAVLPLLVIHVISLLFGVIYTYSYSFTALVSSLFWAHYSFLFLLRIYIYIFFFTFTF